MNLICTYNAKNSIQYCLKLSTSSHNPSYNSVFNCKFKRSFELKPNQIPPLNHHGFLNDLRLTSACTLLAKNPPPEIFCAKYYEM